MPTSTTTRLIRLDGLRGIAVISVLLFHTGYFVVPSVAERLLPGGFLGVDLFFVLSGFLMTNILLGGRQRYGRFYLRRVARILPALYLLLAVQFLYAWAIGMHPGSDLRPYGLIALGMGNWGSAVGVSLPYGLGQTWSLGVEEQLYLLWPLVLVLIGRSDPRQLRRLCLVGIAVALVAKILLLLSGVPADRIYAQTEGRLDDFLVGAFVASLWHGDKRPVRGLPLWAAASGGFLAFALVTADPFRSRWLYEGGFTAVAIAAGVILYACLHDAPGTVVAAARPLRALGRYSYSLYIWHPLIFLAAARALPHDTAARTFLAFGLLAATSVVSTKVVEEPLRRLAARAWSPGSRPKDPVLAISAGS